MLEFYCIIPATRQMNGELSNNMAKRNYGFKKLYFPVCLFGILFGLMIGNWIKGTLLGPYSIAECGFPEMDSFSSTSNEPLLNIISNEQERPKQEKKDTFVIVGIMTAKKYIDSRGLSAFRTWVNSINGKVMFFSSEGSKSSYGVPVVPLPGVDDSYPPQKKSFMMLKYMHDHFIDNYEWFVRADDDVFIKGDKLEKFLRSINSSKPQFIGQAGVGKQEELGQLSLLATENFCMGGPGMIFSRETLRRMAPHVGECLANLYTTHEDVEIGRCVRKYAGIQCTWAYEMQHILYQNYKEDQGSFKKSLKSKEVENAVSLHPVKEPLYLFRIQNYFQSTKIVHLHQKELDIHREIKMMESIMGLRKKPDIQDKLAVAPSLNKYLPNDGHEVLSWEFITKPIFSHFHNNPKRGMEGSLSGALDDVINQIMQLVNKNSRQRGRTIDFKEILYGYRRVNPIFGADYILDLLLIYRKHKGRKMTVPVRRHAYVQQPFFQIEFNEEVPVYQPKPSMGAKMFHIIKHLAIGSENMQNLDKRQEKINFVMPLAGRFKIFERFMKNFEEICLHTKENAQLIVVLFESDHDYTSFENNAKLLQEYSTKYGEKSIKLIKGNGAFSRGRGLELGASMCSNDALLFLVDVDIVMTRSVLNRIRLNTKQGASVYFPIVFSQFDPRTVCLNNSPHCICEHSGCVIDTLDFSQDTGYWRQFGFGIAAMYRSDMVAVGGFDLSIQGWGKEDVDLYQKYIESNITIIRTIDPGMTHVFHDIICDSNLEPAQLVMCGGSQSQSYGALPFLSKTVYESDNIIKRHEQYSLNVEDSLS